MVHPVVYCTLLYFAVLCLSCNTFYKGELHSTVGGGAHCHFAIDFWEKIIRMVKNCDTFFRHFRHNGENGEKIDGQMAKMAKNNGEKMFANFAKRSKMA